MIWKRLNLYGTLSEMLLQLDSTLVAVCKYPVIDGGAVTKRDACIFVCLPSERGCVGRYTGPDERRDSRNGFSE